MAHITDGPLTTPAIRENAPSLLLNEIDQRVVRVRPMSTPIDQISRMMGARPAQSMIVDYYSVDCKSHSAKLSQRPIAVPGLTYSERPVYQISTEEPSLFAPTETILVPRVRTQGKPLVLYVVDGADREASDNSFRAIPLNTSDTQLVESLSTGTTLIRMGRAAGELDVQTPQFEALPVKATNFCQIFKAQIEQSILAKLSAKEAGWTFSDQEEVAVMDMRMGMERSFLFGTKARLSDPRKMDEVLFTEGIWHQAGQEFNLGTTPLDQPTLISLMRKAFTGNAAGSAAKILVAGSALIERLNNLDYTRTVGAADTVTHWGIDFTEIRSKFGVLRVVHSEVFDQCGHSGDGLVIDPGYLTKYVHIPFSLEQLDLKRSGLRNVEALVATEASCLVLRHPTAHMRITSEPILTELKPSADNDDQ